MESITEVRSVLAFIFRGGYVGFVISVCASVEKSLSDDMLNILVSGLLCRIPVGRKYVPSSGIDPVLRENAVELV